MSDEAREVIEDSLMELVGVRREVAQSWVDTIVARLARLDPPIALQPIDPSASDGSHLVPEDWEPEWDE
jgi:hypothetical protein